MKVVNDEEKQKEVGILLEQGSDSQTESSPIDLAVSSNKKIPEKRKTKIEIKAEELKAIQTAKEVQSKKVQEHIKQQRLQRAEKLQVTTKKEEKDDPVYQADMAQIQEKKIEYEQTKKVLANDAVSQKQSLQQRLADRKKRNLKKGVNQSSGNRS